MSQQETAIDNLRRVNARSVSMRELAARYAACPDVDNVPLDALAAELEAFEEKIRAQLELLEDAAAHLDEIRAARARWIAEEHAAKSAAAALVAGWTGDLDPAEALAALDRVRLAELNRRGADAALERAVNVADGRAGTALSKWLQGLETEGQSVTASLLSSLKGPAQGEGYARGLASAQASRLSLVELGFAMLAEPAALAAAPYTTARHLGSMRQAEVDATLAALASGELEASLQNRGAREDVEALRACFRLRAEGVRRRVDRAAA